MTISQTKKDDIIKDFRLHDKDKGSVQIQCAILSERIKNLTVYYQKNKKDFAAKRAIFQLSAARRSFLRYLKGKDLKGYETLIKRLSIRPV